MVGKKMVYIEVHMELLTASVIIVMITPTTVFAKRININAFN